MLLSDHYRLITLEFLNILYLTESSPIQALKLYYLQRLQNTVLVNLKPTEEKEMRFEWKSEESDSGGSI